MTLLGKHLVGMQGWFYTPNDGANCGWGHWFRGAPFSYNASIDLWPDVTGIPDEELEATGLTLADGTPARLWSSYRAATVLRQFRWMAQAGIDGVTVGRFLVGTTPGPTRDRLDVILDNVRKAAEATGRVFCVWYDLSGSDLTTLVSQLQMDWIHLERLGMPKSPAYLQHRGKPLVGIWGAGDTSLPGTRSDWQTLMPWCKTRSTVLLGGPRDWYTDPIMAQADVISPWAVTTFANAEGADAYRRDVLVPDLALTKQRGQDYLPVVWPGFSCGNQQQRPGQMNTVPRFGGRFYWKQIINTIQAGAQCLFTAMWDESDEGTCLMPTTATTNESPREGTWLALDADGERVPSDWYVQLAGAAGRVLRGEQRATDRMPSVLEMTMPRLIDATVRDATTKQPLGGALVQWWDQTGKSDARTTDGNGYANFGSITSPGITVAAFANGHAMYTGYVTTIDGHLVVEVPPLVRPFDPAQAGYLRTQGHGFVTEDGKPWLFAGYSAHTLISDVAKGDDQKVHALCEYMRSLGANTCWTIGTHLSQWKKDNGFYHDSRSADHPKVLARMLDLFAEHKLRVCYGLLADAQGLSRSEQQSLWLRDGQVVKDRWNVVYAKGNEDRANGWNPGELVNKLDVGRVLLSQGSRGGDQTPFSPNLDIAMWETRLTKDTPEFKVLDDAGTGSRELQAGYTGASGPVPACPVLLIIETVIFHDTNPDQFGDFRSTDPAFALALGVNIAANCAGGSFGSTMGLIARPNGPIADACAKAWFRGMWAGFVR